MPKNTIVDGIVGSIDLSPTVLDFLGLKIPSTFQGRTFLPLLEGRADKIQDGIVSECLTEDGERKYAYRTRDLKYIYTMANGGVVEELYDLSLDPGERVNVAHKHNETEKLKSRILKHISSEEKKRRALFGYD